MTMYCLGFAFDKCTQVLLIRKIKPVWQAGKLNGVGGMIESGESPQQAMVREFREESDILTYESDWTPRGLMEGKVGIPGEAWQIYVFMAKLGMKFPVNPYSPTSETLVVKKVDSLWKCKDLIFNLNWIIPYCLDQNMKPFNVIHQS
jgi:8-oxo-dGTP diphosphatase